MSLSLPARISLGLAGATAVGAIGVAAASPGAIASLRHPGPLACSNPRLRRADNAVVVYGSALKADGTPGTSFERRLRVAQRILSSDPHSVAIVTGHSKYGTALEGAAGEDWLVAHGSSPSRIIQENRATDTRLNAEYSIPIIACVQPRVITDVTEPFHIQRADALMREGLQAEHLDIPVVDAAAQNVLTPAEASQAATRERIFQVESQAKELWDYLSDGAPRRSDGVVEPG